MRSEELLKGFSRFFELHYWDALVALAESGQHHFEFDFAILDKFNSELAEELLENPAEALEAGQAALAELGSDLPIDDDWEFCHIILRPFNLPRTTQRTARELRDADGEKLRAVRGLVRVVTDRSSILRAAAFTCMRCSFTQLVDQPINRFKEPSVCGNQACDRRGPMKLSIEKSKRADYKKLILQDAPEDMAGFEQPSEIDVVLFDDLIESVRPGDRVTINGVIHLITQEGSPILESYIEAVSIEKDERAFQDIEISDEEKERILDTAKDPQILDILPKSIASSIFGYEVVKTTLAIQLFGSDAVIDPRDGSRKRGDIHVLLVGDPSTAKSQLLRFMSRIIPGSVMTSGKGSSYAGLTASAVKVDKEWQLSAGALVIANGSLCAVDEIGQMDKEQTSALHEAMEGQQISIAKAGIVAQLPTACAVLAAENPKLGYFDDFEPIAPQINLPQPLITRFDIIHKITDKPSPGQDRAIAEHILSTAKVNEDGVLDFDFLRKYVAYARKEIHPVMTDAARKVLVDSYVSVRGSSDSGSIPITVRSYQSLIRIAYAIARMRLSRAVNQEDAEFARDHLMKCLEGFGVDPETGLLDSQVVELGISKTVTDKTKFILNTIRALAKDHQSGIVPIIEVEEVAAGKGISPDDANAIIDRMRRDGALFSPRQGTVKES